MHARLLKGCEISGGRRRRGRHDAWLLNVLGELQAPHLIYACPCGFLGDVVVGDVQPFAGLFVLSRLAALYILG
jgi:hypothetical protein